jgi:SAM-dependent methyltransferase
MSREKLYDFIPKDRPVLEIGPRENPFIRKETHDVYYADIRSEYEVVALYERTGQNLAGLAHIDYVIDGTYKQTVGGKKFAAVFSSHVIEHTADIIGHLTELSKILEEGGRIVLCVPDKRFTFDYFRETTPFSQAYAVYRKGDALWRFAFDYFSRVPAGINYSVGDYMNGSAIFAKEQRLLAEVTDLADNWENNIGGFHTWCFTYRSFLAFFRDALRFKLLPFVLRFSSSPIIGGNEFHIVLEKNAGLLSDNKMLDDEVSKISSLIERPAGREELRTFIETCEKPYLYGAVWSANCVLNRIGFEWANKVAGLVCSDNYPKEPFCLPVFHLSELSPSDRIGFVMLLSESAKSEVVPNLLRLGYKNILEQPSLG